MSRTRRKIFGLTGFISKPTELAKKLKAESQSTKIVVGFVRSGGVFFQFKGKRQFYGFANTNGHIHIWTDLKRVRYHFEDEAKTLEDMVYKVLQMYLKYSKTIAPEPEFIKDDEWDLLERKRQLKRKLL